MKFMAYAVMFFCYTGLCTDILVNGDFSASDASRRPIGWVFPKDVGREVCGIKDGTLCVSPVKVSAMQGQVLQRMHVGTNRCIAVSGEIRSSIPGCGFIQVKLFSGKKELERVSLSPSSGYQWTRVKSDIYTGNADTMEILCRWKREKKYIGAEVLFRGISAEDLGEKERRPMIPAKLECVPTYESMGVTVSFSGDWDIREEGRILYRKAGNEKWEEARHPVMRRSEGEARGSILGLCPGTEYEVMFKALVSGRSICSKAATWACEQKIGRVVRIPEMEGSENALVVSERGTRDAWVKIIPEKRGGRISLKKGCGPNAVRFDGAEFVVFEGFVICGGDDDAVRVEQSHDVIIRGCDISEWGEKGTADSRGVATNGLGKAINIQSGISIHKGAERITVEQNFIHSPRGSANSWRYGHPHGPSAVSMSNPNGNIVIRHNDMIGSEESWWNDGVEGEYNSYVTGGPNRDTDFYGNVVAFANDDGIELDGGQRNVRCFGNLFRWTYCGISCAPNMRGPSYIYRNVIELGDERENANFGVKSGGAKFKDQGLTEIFRNTIVSHGSCFSSGHYGDGPSPINCASNVFYMGNVNYRYKSGASFCGDIVSETDFPEHLLDPPSLSKPIFIRPELVSPETGDYRLSGKCSSLSVGAFDPHDEKRIPYMEGRKRLSSNIEVVNIGTNRAGKVIFYFPENSGSSWYAVPSSEWISCEPSEGDIPRTRTLVLKMDLSKAPEGRRRGALTVRTDAGFFKTVFLDAVVMPEIVWASDYEAEAAEIIGFSVSAVEGASGGACIYADDGVAHFEAKAQFNVEVPETGFYRIWGRTKSTGPNTGTHDSFYVSIDGGEARRWDLQGRSSSFWTWNPVNVWDGHDTGRIELSRGHHEITVFSREQKTMLDVLRISNHSFFESRFSWAGSADY